MLVSYGFERCFHFQKKFLKMSCGITNRQIKEIFLHTLNTFLNYYISHTHTHTRLFLLIVGTFHRLLLLLYWPNNIFCPLTNPNPKPTPYRKPVCIVTLSDKHLFIFFFSSGVSRPVPKKFRFYYPCGDIWSSQCSINKFTDTHTHTHTHTCTVFKNSMTYTVKHIFIKVLFYFYF